MKKQSAFLNNGYIDTDFQFFNNSESRTFMTWIKFLESENEPKSSIIGQRNGSIGRAELFAVNNKIAFYSPSCGAENYSKTEIKNNKWYHIALVLDTESKKIKIYLNGKLEIEFDINNDFINSNVSIGKYPDTSYLLNGYMTEIRFYNYAMTNKDILSKMNKIENKNNIKLLGYYNFQDDLLDITEKINNIDVKNIELSSDYPKEIKMYKFLLKQNNDYYAIKSEFFNNGQYKPLDIKINPTIEEFKSDGFDDIGLLMQDVTINKEMFKPIDKLKTINNGKFNIIMKEIE